MERGYCWYVDGGGLDYISVWDEEEFLANEKENILEYIYEYTDGFDGEEREEEPEHTEPEEEDNFDVANATIMLLSACC